jgi:hypothetical protein
MRKKNYLRYFRSLFGTSPAHLLEVLETCSGEWPVALAELERSILEQNGPETVKWACRLKSCFVYTGQSEMVASLERIESSCRESGRWTEVRMILEVVKTQSREPLEVFGAEAKALRAKVG